MADVDIAHKSVIACHLANIAVRLQRYIRWDAANERITGDDEGHGLVGRDYRRPWSMPEV